MLLRQQNRIKVISIEDGKQNNHNPIYNLKLILMKISIRLFDDKEVRAIWDEENKKWYFSVVDVVGILNEEEDYIKAGNY
jgi:hypothetical protein